MSPNYTQQSLNPPNNSPWERWDGNDMERASTVLGNECEMYEALFASNDVQIPTSGPRSIAGGHDATLRRCSRPRRDCLWVVRSVVPIIYRVVPNAHAGQ